MGNADVEIGVRKHSPRWPVAGIPAEARGFGISDVIESRSPIRLEPGAGHWLVARSTGGDALTEAGALLRHYAAGAFLDRILH